MQISGKKGGTPKKKDVCFLAPDGEEVKNKRQLDKYLKAHPGTLTAADFDWGIPGWLYIFSLPCWSGCACSRWCTQLWSSLDPSLPLLMHMLLKDTHQAWWDWVSSFFINMKINLASWHLDEGNVLTVFNLLELSSCTCFLPKLPWFPQSEDACGARNCKC